jgi:hypothetical protein
VRGTATLTGTFDSSFWWRLSGGWGRGGSWVGQGREDLQGSGKSKDAHAALIGRGRAALLERFWCAVAFGGAARDAVGWAGDC